MTSAHIALPGIPGGHFAVVQAEIVLGALEAFVECPVQAEGASSSQRVVPTAAKTT